MACMRWPNHKTAASLSRHSAVPDLTGLSGTKVGLATVQDIHEMASSLASALLQHSGPFILGFWPSCADRQALRQNATCPSRAVMIEGNTLTASSLDLLRPDVLLQDYAVRMGHHRF